MAMNLVKLPTGKSNLQLRVSKGHYATSHSHINYYIDVTLTKFRLSEARAAAAELVREYKSTTIVDTILCLDGTEVIGACMASELTKAGSDRCQRGPRGSARRLRWSRPALRRCSGPPARPQNGQCRDPAPAVW